MLFIWIQNILESLHAETTGRSSKQSSNFNTVETSYFSSLNSKFLGLKFAFLKKYFFFLPLFQNSICGLHNFSPFPFYLPIFSTFWTPSCNNLWFPTSPKWLSKMSFVIKSLWGHTQYTLWNHRTSGFSSLMKMIRDPSRDGLIMTPPQQSVLE